MNRLHEPIGTPSCILFVAAVIGATLLYIAACGECFLSDLPRFEESCSRQGVSHKERGESCYNIPSQRTGLYETEPARTQRVHVRANPIHHRLTDLAPARSLLETLLFTIVE